MSDDSHRDKKRNELPIMKAGENCDCNPGECCPTDSSSSKPTHRGIKSAIFIIIMLTAVAVGAYSLIGNHKGPDTPAEEIVIDPALDYIATLQSGYANEFLGDKDFALITLGGAGAALDENKRVEALVEDVAALIRKKDITVKTASAVPGDPVFARIVDLFDMSGLPAVLAMKKDGGSIVIDSNITENTLLTVYLTGCNPSAGCAPGCDPKDCE